MTASYSRGRSAASTKLLPRRLLSHCPLENAPSSVALLPQCLLVTGWMCGRRTSPSTGHYRLHLAHLRSPVFPSDQAPPSIRHHRLLLLHPLQKSMAEHRQQSTTKEGAALPSCVDTQQGSRRQPVLKKMEAQLNYHVMGP
ncbi:hypothetical protein BS78_09G093700 [Paspalum vaginatum]|nr:hypothetical protein BS78_09G093700 [Paspalum vaginatum]KAJ1262266.1 hypothetical protein BS78_09G093700 [Paspalum vaginatum]